ncbi:BA14K family protein [Microvirga antarctica]|uniref:BA14K family protein n=1 Tax=Microvirga antarctica TaxID=2819233 RepID=UPI001B3081D8|nr:BA14K family protein [Microvirga antarctica]
MRKFIAAVLGVVTLMPVLPAAADVVPTPAATPDVQQAYPSESYSQYYRRGYGYYGRPYYGRPYYRDNGAAVAAGVAGVAAGALIAGAIANQAAQPAAPPPPGTVSPSVAAYCARKYRSYDPASGTFLSNNGMRYVCTYP